MSDSARSSTSSGVGFMGLLTILFIGLKLGHVIVWPWGWVLAPLWLPLAVSVSAILVIGVFAAIGFGVVALISSLQPRLTAAEMRRRRK